MEDTRVRDERRRLDAVFSALSDPTRRSLVARLVREGPRTATDLACRLSMIR